MAMLAQNADTLVEAPPAEYARLVPGPTSTVPARRRFAMPDTTPAGEAAYQRDRLVYSPIYHAADEAAKSSDWTTVRRAAACQAWIAERLGFGKRLVLTHLRQAARARRAARGST